MQTKSATKNAKQQLDLSPSHGGQSPLREGSAKKPRRAPHTHNLPLYDTYIPQVTLDITKPKSINITFSPRDHKLSTGIFVGVSIPDYQWRTVPIDTLPTSDRRAPQWGVALLDEGQPRVSTRTREKSITSLSAIIFSCVEPKECLQIHFC